VVGVVVGFLSASCGSTDSSGGPRDPSDGGGAGGVDGGGSGRFSPQIEQAWSAFCDARAAKARQCNITSPSACPATSCLSTLYDERLIPQFILCQSEKTCTDFLDPNACIRSVGTIDAPRQAFLDRCESKISGCASNFGAYCAVGLPIVLRSVMDSVDACLSEPCADLDACLTNVELPDCW
jgi:hypothetical protein